VRRVLVQIPTYPSPILLVVPEFEKLPPVKGLDASVLEWKPLPEKTEKPRQEKAEISHELLTYLGVIANYPFENETSHDDRMTNWSRAIGSRVRTKLKEMGLLEEHGINLYEPGRKIKIALPTDAGYALLDKYKIAYKVPQGNGGIPHRYWQHVVAEKLRKDGWEAEVEQCLWSKRVDVGAIRKGVKVAHEILMERIEKELSNLEKDLEDGWNLVVFCVDYEETRERLAKLIPETEDRVEVWLLKEFL